MEQIKLERHVEAIRIALNKYGIEQADYLNKIALEMKAISVDTYLAAARILVEAFLAQ